jgi:cysteine synthase
MPAIKVAMGQKQYTNDVWMYRYELITKSGIETGWKATHAAELPAMFDCRDHEFSHFIYDGEPDVAYKKILSAVKIQLDGSLYLFMDNLARKLNNEELADLNSLNAHIMVTSRQKNSAFPSVDLDVLGQEEALTMFFRYYNGDNDRSYIGPARDIVTSVDRHTLLVELLAKAAARTGGTLEDFAKDLAKKEGIMCGISSGTNVAAAIVMATKLGAGKKVVTVLPDTAERYFSTELFHETAEH